MFVADLKAFVSDVKPALQSALDAEFEKNPYEVKLSDLIVALEFQFFKSLVDFTDLSELNLIIVYFWYRDL